MKCTYLLLLHSMVSPTPTTGARRTERSNLRSNILLPPSSLQGTGNTGSCQWMITCEKCALSGECGWCSDCGRCVEGGTTGPSATNCKAWDYNRCSGESEYTDRSVADHEEESKERKKLVQEYDQERDRYVRENFCLFFFVFVFSLSFLCLVS